MSHRRSHHVVTRSPPAPFYVSGTPATPHGTDLTAAEKEPDMTITPNLLTRWAGIAAAAAGAIFIGVQINHPQLSATSIQTTDVYVRDSLKLLMGVLALAGITGMYLHQVRKNGLLGLIGYLVFAAGYLSIICVSFTAAYVLPEVATSSAGFV